MQLQELFDELLTERQVGVRLDSRAASESLRVQLSKKWAVYKKLMDSCGFLSDDLAACSLGRRLPLDSESNLYTYTLAPRVRSVTSYQVVTELPEPVILPTNLERDSL